MTAHPKLTSAIRCLRDHGTPGSMYRVLADALEELGELKQRAESAEARASLAEALAGERKQELSYAHQEKLGLEEELEAARARVGELTAELAELKRKNEPPPECPVCTGAGTIFEQGDEGELSWSSLRECDVCRGSGVVGVRIFAQNLAYLTGPAHADKTGENPADAPHRELLPGPLVKPEASLDSTYRYLHNAASPAADPAERIDQLWCAVHCLAQRESAKCGESPPRDSGGELVGRWRCTCCKAEAHATEVSMLAAWRALVPNGVLFLQHRCPGNHPQCGWFNAERIDDGRHEARAEAPETAGLGAAAREVDGPSGVHDAGHVAASGEAEKVAPPGLTPEEAEAGARRMYEIIRARFGIADWPTVHGDAKELVLMAYRFAHSEGAKAAKAKARRSEFYDKRDWVREAQETIDKEGWPSRDRAAAYLAVCMSESWIDGHHWTLGQAAKAKGGAKVAEFFDRFGVYVENLLATEYARTGVGGLTLEKFRELRGRLV